MAATYSLIAFLCLAGALLTTGAVVKNDKGCPEDWTQFGTRCFKFFNNKMSWTEAEKSCNSHGANLASIHSNAENDFSVKLIKDATGTNHYTWLGGNDVAKEGEWVWTDGSPWNFWKWNRHEPTGRGEAYLMTNFFGAGHWNDINNLQSYPFICARNVPPPPEPKDKSVTMSFSGMVCKCTFDPK